MPFLDTYTLEQPVGKEAAISKIASSPTLDSGAYSGGIISVLDVDLSSRLMHGWGWMFKDSPIPILATGLGDVILWSPSQGAVYYLEVQRAKVSFIDHQLDYVLNEFLTIDGVQSDLLRKKHLLEIKNSAGELCYGQCYILKPWLMLGGVDAPEYYERGDISVYLSLVGQTYQKSVDSA